MDDLSYRVYKTDRYLVVPAEDAAANRAELERRGREMPRDPYPRRHVGFNAALQGFYAQGHTQRVGYPVLGSFANGYPYPW
jgi:hypothetical protein